MYFCSFSTAVLSNPDEIANFARWHRWTTFCSNYIRWACGSWTGPCQCIKREKRIGWKTQGRLTTFVHILQSFAGRSRSSFQQYAQHWRLLEDYWGDFICGCLAALQIDSASQQHGEQHESACGFTWEPWRVPHYVAITWQYLLELDENISTGPVGISKLPCTTVFGRHLPLDRARNCVLKRSCRSRRHNLRKEQEKR